MRQEIIAKVGLDSGNPLVMVRKTVFREDGKVEKKYGLGRDGRWIEVPEAAMYPEECYLPIKFWKARICP